MDPFLICPQWSSFLIIVPCPFCIPRFHFASFIACYLFDVLVVLVNGFPDSLWVLGLSKPHGTLKGVTGALGEFVLGVIDRKVGFPSLGATGEWAGHV